MQLPCPFRRRRNSCFWELLCTPLFLKLQGKNTGQSSAAQIVFCILACMKSKGVGRGCKHYGERGKKKIQCIILNLLSPDQGNISNCQCLLPSLIWETSVLSTWQRQGKHCSLTISACSIHHFIYLSYQIIHYHST